METEELFADDADPYQARLDADARERMGHVGRMVARVWMDPNVRQLFGYMLDEPAWLVDPIRAMAVRPDGAVWSQLEWGGKPRSPMQVFQYGPAPPPVRAVQPFCDYDLLVEKVRDVARRAELDEADAEWLATLPRVVDLRRHL